MPPTTEFPIIFEALKRILQKYAPRLVVTEDTPDGYSLNTPYSETYHKELFFGAVQVNKNYVSFHLMPVYMYPDLLKDLSDRLRQRMQGKSCFNFKVNDQALFRELAQLTQKSAARARREKLL
jgi:hypothetical protein